jgi:hypothetical protein
MRELCHRCHGDLPTSTSGSRMDDESIVLFCPSCGAPQIHLQEHMHAEAPAAAIPNTTGAAPPPQLAGANPAHTDWRAVILSGALVAAIGAALSVAGMKFGLLAFFGMVWTVSCAVITLGLYAKQHPAHRMDARTGARIGIVAGVLMIAAVGVATATAGVILRFGTHRMTQFDQENAERRKAMESQFISFLQQNSQDKEVAATYIAALNSPRINSPEMLAGSALGGGAMQALLILLLSAGGGAFAGMMRAAQTQRLGSRRGN